jgi:hypothetical protein
MAFCRKDKLTRHRKTHSNNKKCVYSLCAVPCSKNERLASESGQEDISNVKQLASPNFESGCSYRKEEEGGGGEEDPDAPLSRLGQNPEILLFPIPRQ